MEALRRFRAHEIGETDVIGVVRQSRLLIPLVAEPGATGVNDHGVTVDKSQELSIVTVAGPDGRDVLPVFTSVHAMRLWNPKARPVPVIAPRVALAAVSELTDLVVLDPTSATEFVIRRPALWALSQSRPWIPSYLDPQVLDAFMASAEPEGAILAVQLSPGDPESRLAGPELLVVLVLIDGLDRTDLAAVTGRLRDRWAESEIIAERVDSLAVQLVSTP
jgi:hypothetical protein